MTFAPEIARSGGRAMSAAVSVTFFRDYAAQTMRVQEMTLPELRALILSTTAKRKDLLPWLKLARFGNQRTPARSLRHDANVLAITGIELDYDDEKISLDTAAGVLRKLRLQSLLYTSPSHCDQQPRWRILLPTSKVLPPGERVRLAGGVNALFGGIFSPESFVLSQSYYFGSINSNRDRRAVIVKGKFVDCVALPAPIVSSKRGSSARQPQAHPIADPFTTLAEKQILIAPINVEERLAEMQYRGPGETGIHNTQLSVTAALLKRGYRINTVIEQVLAATVEAAGREGAGWDWRKEARDLRAMCKSWLAKHPRRVFIEPVASDQQIKGT